MLTEKTFFLLYFNLDLDDCSPNPCLNGGSCKDTGAEKFQCSCDDGFTGNTCETSKRYRDLKIYLKI